MGSTQICLGLPQDSSINQFWVTQGLPGGSDGAGEGSALGGLDESYPPPCVHPAFLWAAEKVYLHILTW